MGLPRSWLRWPLGIGDVEEVVAKRVKGIDGAEELSGGGVRTVEARCTRRTSRNA